MSTTIPGLLTQRATASPTKVAVRSHGYGVWEPTTWKQLLDRVTTVGNGLASLGVTSGSVVAILGDNSLEWIIADLAVTGLGAATFGIDPAASPASVRKALSTQRVAACLVADQEQFDKVAEIGVDVGPVIVVQTRGIRNLDETNRDDRDRFLTFKQLEALGASGTWSSQAAAVSSNSTAAVVMDANGSISRLSHAAVIANHDRIASAVGLGDHDELLPQRSFSLAAERAMSLTGMLTKGLSVLLSQDARLAGLEASSAQPTVIHASPRWAAGLQADLERRISETKGLKRIALRQGYKPKAPGSAAKAPGFPPMRALGILMTIAILVFFAVTNRANDWVRIAIALGALLGAGAAAVMSGISVPGPLRRRFGLSRTRAVVASDPLSVEAMSMFGALGVPVVSLDRQSFEQSLEVQP
jgi:long-chain acyl-CoA synthetase